MGLSWPMDRSFFPRFQDSQGSQEALSPLPAPTRCARASLSPPARVLLGWGLLLCWFGNNPRNCFIFDLPCGFHKALPGLLAGESPKAVAAPPLLSPLVLHPSPHPTAPQSLWVGGSLQLWLPRVWGVHNPNSLLHGGKTGARRHTRTQTRRTLTELSYFRLLLFVVVSTVLQSRYIYILYIYFLNYTINVQKTGVHC